MTKSIHIDTKNRTITMIEIGDYKDLQKAVEGYIEALPLSDFPGTVWVNEEGLINGTPYFFAFRGHHAPIAGNGVIQGECDDEGDTGDVTITLDQAATCVRFLEPHEVESWVEDHANVPAISFGVADANGNVTMTPISTYGDVMAHMRPEKETPPA